MTDAKIVSEDHWAKKGDIDLYMHRKYAEGGEDKKPVLFLVHGSSTSARTTFDLEVPGNDEYSMMNVFAGYGFDVWTMDHEGYGRSSRSEGYSYIKDGVEDLRAATAVVERLTGSKAFAVFGSSSGALRAGAFCNAEPGRVERLILSAFPWTGEGAPTLIKRRERLAEWQSGNRRKVDADYYRNMYTRDTSGLTLPELGEVAAQAELANGGDSVPNGTYIDMCINLPVMDPAKMTCPVMMIRAEHDGITTDEDTANFYAALATKDKQLIALAGQAHNITVGVNRHRFWHVVRAFLELPGRVDKG